MDQKNIILTSYFTSKKDPIFRRTKKDPQAAFYGKRRFFSANEFLLMKPWYESLCRLSLSGVVFHDRLAPWFVSQYENDMVSFVSYEPNKRSANDERFFCFRDYLLKIPEIENVFLTDLFDLSFFKDPFEIITDDFDLYVGQEERFSYGWMNRKFKKVYGQAYPKGHKLLNAGIIGGKREAVLELLNAMTRDLARIKPSRNANMQVLNKCARELFDKERIFSGPPLHSLFKQYETQGDFFIQHK